MRPPAVGYMCVAAGKGQKSRLPFPSFSNLSVTAGKSRIHVYLYPFNYLACSSRERLEFTPMFVLLLVILSVAAGKGQNSPLPLSFYLFALWQRGKARNHAYLCPFSYFKCATRERLKFRHTFPLLLIILPVLAGKGLNPRSPLPFKLFSVWQQVKARFPAYLYPFILGAPAVQGQNKPSQLRCVSQGQLGCS